MMPLAKSTMPSTAKTLLWQGDTPHFSYYDQPENLDRKRFLAPTFPIFA